MFIQEMTDDECFQSLKDMKLARLACARDNQPYIVPISFAYEEPYLYGFTTPGMKVEWMRANPLVCVETDEVEADDRWISIVIFGRYEELEGPSEGIGWDQEQRRPHPPGKPVTGSARARFFDRERLKALELLQRHANWWEVGVASAGHRDREHAVTPIFYRIAIERMTGRRATPAGPVARHS